MLKSKVIMIRSTELRLGSQDNRLGHLIKNTSRSNLLQWCFVRSLLTKSDNKISNAVENKFEIRPHLKTLGLTTPHSGNNPTINIRF